MFIFCDGCDSYVVTADLTKRWATAGAAWSFGGAASGKFAGGSISVSATTGAALVSSAWPVTAAVNQMVGFWFKAAAIPSASQLLLELDGASATSGLLYVDNAGHLFGRIGAPTGTALIHTTLINVCDGSWHWIEVQFGSTGQFNTYVDGVACGLISGGGVTIGVVQVQLWPTGVAMNIDDLIIWDATPSNLNTGTANQSFGTYPIGPRQISTLRPTSDASVQFATTVGGSGGTHFSTLDEVSPDGDTSYCQDATSGHQDTLGFADLSYVPAVINSVILSAYLKLGVPGSINNTLVAVSGSTTGPSAYQATPSAYALRQVNYDADPATTTFWAAAAVNAATFGYKNS
jgi:hypothetical protein